jgi:hypothetical protein
MFLLLLLAVLAVPLMAQGDVARASLTGTVLDSSGGAVAEARLTLSSRDSGITRRAVTGSRGEYAFHMLPPGAYLMRVQKMGFRVLLIPDLALGVGQSLSLDPAMELGLISQAIEVRVPMLKTADANLGSEIESGQVRELPLNVRNVFGLVSLDSSVSNSVLVQGLNPSGSQGTADQDIAFLNFGGGRFGTTAFLLDGHWNGAGDWNGIIFVPSVDELQEFRVETRSFSPQYGWSMGSAVNAITKSGSATFHGSVFEFARNSLLDANSFFNDKNGLARPRFSRNQFGLTAGGPLYVRGVHASRDRTFFFASYEGLRQQTPTTLVTTVPADLERNGDFSKTHNANGSLVRIFNPFTVRKVDGGFVRDPFPMNQVPLSLFDPVAIRLLRFYPRPNRPGDPVTGANNFVTTAGLPTESDQYSVRLDQNISDNQRFFGRWSQKREAKQLSGDFFGSDNPGGLGTRAPNNRFDGALGYSYAPSPTLVLQAAFGFGRWAEGRRPQGYPFDPSSLGLPPALDSFNGPGSFPGITVTGLQSLGSGDFNLTPREARTYSADLSKNSGTHSLSFGFTAVDSRLTTINSSQFTASFEPAFTEGPDPSAADPTTGAGLASLLLGVGSAGGVTWTARAAFRKILAGWYFNDEWKVLRNLTLSLGLRYDFQTAPVDRFNRLSYWTPARNPLGDRAGLNLNGGLEYTGDGNPRGVYDPQHTNFAPRVGISYSLTQRLVMRAGFGLFYTPAIEFGDYEGLALNGFTQATPYVGSVDGITPASLLRDPFPNGLLSPPGKAAGMMTNVGLSTNAVERSRPTPYVEQWTYAIDYELPYHTMLEASYIGNHGVKLPYGPFERNQLPPQYLSLGTKLLDPVPNPFYGLITVGPLSQPTVPRAQLLRPYPQFDSVLAVQPPAGMSTYHALELSLNRRFAGGLQFLVSFTASKYISTPEGFEGWAAGNANIVRNWYDTSLEKSLMSDDIPRSLVASYIYELPVGKGKRMEPRNSLVEALIGGWQISGIGTLKSGFPLAMTTVTNNTNSFGGGQRPNIIGDPHVANPTIDRWFNTAAFAQPAPFTFGDVPRTIPNLRAPGLVNFDSAVHKNFNLRGEHGRLQVRGEFYNLANHANFYAPNTQLGNPNFGVITNALPARSIQFGARYDW